MPRPVAERKRRIRMLHAGCLSLSVAMMIAAIPLIVYKSERLLGIILAISAVASLWAIIEDMIKTEEKLQRDQDKEEQDERLRQAEGELDKHIQTALRKMESLGGSYGNEENANQQLCLMLRELMPGVDVQLVKPGRAGEGKGDIRIGNTIIEGKLDLEDKHEMDRLVGQLQDYCSSTPCQVRVVVYGRLRSDFRRRIEGLPQYYNRILLHHIGGMKTRRPDGKQFTDEYDS
ncbi:MAG: hypothetical protein NTZ04_08875 [Chloroflexi bacterium]|nr:hypothetical protein [Chloroflexota bacterium]